MTIDRRRPPDGGTAQEPHRRSTGQGRVTLQTIAEALSVSTATVSLALRNSPQVAEATRAMVRDYARMAGYSYNRSAAALRTARTNIIGLGFHDITNPYFAELLLAIETTVLEKGKSILLGTYAEDLARQERVLGTMSEYRPDGMIICPAAGTTPADYETLMAAKIPIVQIVREIDDCALDFVGTDDIRGTALAVDHLVALGHRRIALIGGLASTSTGRNRREGYRSALLRHGLTWKPMLTGEGPATRDTGFRVVQEMMRQPDPPTAVICFNDLVAFGAMLGLRQSGREPGRDVALIGSDDIEEADHWLPGLTTIRNHQAEIGHQAAILLLRRMADPCAPLERVLLEPTLVLRGTTMPCPR